MRGRIAAGIYGNHDETKKGHRISHSFLFLSFLFAGDEDKKHSGFGARDKGQGGGKWWRQKVFHRKGAVLKMGETLRGGESEELEEKS